MEITIKIRRKTPEETVIEEIKDYLQTKFPNSIMAPIHRDGATRPNPFIHEELTIYTTPDDVPIDPQYNW